MALAGFTLLHLGNIYDGAPKYDQFQVIKIIQCGEIQTCIHINLLVFKMLHFMYVKKI